MSCPSERLLFSYIAYGCPHFVKVKESLMRDYVTGKMSSLQYHHNLRLLYSAVRDCDKYYIS